MQMPYTKRGPSVYYSFGEKKFFLNHPVENCQALTDHFMSDNQFDIQFMENIYDKYIDVLCCI